MSYHIDQIDLVETGLYEYRINFIYNGHQLQTGNIAKSNTLPTIIPILQNVCSVDDSLSADANYTSLKNQFQGKSADI